MSSPLPFLRPQRFIACWPGDDNPTMKALGEHFMLPRVDEVAIAGQGRFRLSSAQDEQGRYIPGTVVIEDKVRRGESQELIKSLDARELIQMFHTNESKAPGGGLLGRGLTFVSTPEEARAAIAAGRAVWVESMVAGWRAVVQENLNYRRNWREKNGGEEPPPSSSEGDVRNAANMLKKYAAQAKVERSAVTDDDLLEALNGTGATEAPAPKAAPAPAAAIVSDDTETAQDEDRAYGLLLYDEARKYGVKVLKEDMAGILDGDGKAIADLENKVAAAKKQAQTEATA